MRGDTYLSVLAHLVVGSLRRSVGFLEKTVRTRKGQASADVRDFESLLTFFSDEEIEELRAH